MRLSLTDDLNPAINDDNDLGFISGIVGLTYVCRGERPFGFDSLLMSGNPPTATVSPFAPTSELLTPYSHFGQTLGSLGWGGEPLTSVL